MAQNGHAMPQPAWLETHSVDRFGYCMSTDSTFASSNRCHSVFTVVPPSALSVRDARRSGGKSDSVRPSRVAAGRSVMSAGSEVR